MCAAFPHSNDLKVIPQDFWEFHQNRNSPEQPISDRDTFTLEEQQSICQEFENRKRFYASLGENIVERESELIEGFDPMRMAVFWENLGCVGGKQGQTPWYQLLYGDENSAGLFVTKGKGKFQILYDPTVQNPQTFSICWKQERLMLLHFQTNC